MREIKFRGKQIDTKEWVYGGIVHRTDYYGNKCDKYFIIDGESTYDYEMGENQLVDGNTVGQFTGLRDKNGKEIYEGDIVCSRFPEECEHAGEICNIGDIQFRDGMFGIEWKQWKNDTFWGLRRLDEDFHKEIEVIGNIYDNPELLEGKQ